MGKGLTGCEGSTRVRVNSNCVSKTEPKTIAIVLIPISESTDLIFSEERVHTLSESTDLIFSEEKKKKKTISKITSFENFSYSL